jgi:hypothetical protein
MIQNIQAVSVMYHNRKVGMIIVGTNIRISRARCLQIMEEVREGIR